jgi:hypothetical protein
MFREVNDQLVLRKEQLAKAIQLRNDKCAKQAGELEEIIARIDVELIDKSNQVVARFQSPTPDEPVSVSGSAAASDGADEMKMEESSKPSATEWKEDVESNIVALEEPLQSLLGQVESDIQLGEARMKAL